jgi:hypothetical protein
MAPLRPAEARRLDRYLGELSAALAPLAADDRAEIVREARSHVVERLGRPEGDLEVILGDMGPPAAYAASFREARGDRTPAAADDGGSTTGQLMRRGAGAAAAVLHGVAALLVLVALYKLAWPSRIGVWSLPAMDPEKVRLHFSVGSDPPAGNDLLGLWMVPLALVLAVALVALARLAKRGGRAQTS